MPAFTLNGPDIPEHLIQAHEDGNVVFFCGAGISYRAGLPGFEGLVDDIYEALGTTKTEIEKKAYDKQQYDAVLHQLERRYPGRRIAVRTVLDTVLKPKWYKKGATETHQSLLQLATDRNGVIRLVTTNFDQIFERAARKNKLKMQCYSAPLLPIPKQSRWNGIVYLHGVMPTSHDEAALNRLILTSGDFGLAYLTERWAARFVSQLFKDFIVCFVGYSINDPVLRYMMDALAADELLGEDKTEAYAFADYKSGSKEDAYTEWEAKGVTPLLYEVPIGTKDHTRLFDTLNEWSKTYRDGMRGKEMVIAQHASSAPLASSRSDFAVGRVLWALSDSLAAKHFSELVPVPPLKWLEPFSENQFTHRDLPKFGVVPERDIDEKLAYSLIYHPSPYTQSPRMSLVDFRSQGTEWDDVMRYIANWLLRHIGDHELILWLVRNGGELNNQFKEMVESRIFDLEKLAVAGKEDELEAIQLCSPNAIPDPLIKALWRVVLKGRIKTTNHRHDLFEWLRRLKYEDVTPTLRFEFRELLAPCIMIRPSFHRVENENTEITEVKKIKDIVDWELVLASDFVHSTLLEPLEKEDMQPKLPQLLDDVTLLLTDALDLSRELGGADDKSDLSFIYQPSISKHEQNRAFRDWTALIDLAREAWLVTLDVNCAKATKVAENWWQTPYPVFKRMAMFAATQGHAISQDKSIEWILSDSAWWLWSTETQRELYRLLFFLSPKLNTENRTALEHAILVGPPKEILRADLDAKKTEEISERETWHRLAKMHASGAVLGSLATDKFKQLSQEHALWALGDDEKDEFPYWMGEVRDGEQEAPPEFELAPSTRTELVEWLRKNPSSERLHHQDGWSERCRERVTDAVGALSDLAAQGEWLTDRWRTVFQVGTEDELIQPFWENSHEVIVSAPDQFIESIAHSLSAWIQAIAKTFEDHESDFFKLCNRLLALEHKDGVQTEEPVMRAINHPVGHVTEALVRWWYRGNLKDGQGLHESIKPIFTEICNVDVEKFRHGRVLLAAHAITLFRVDQGWTEKHLLSLFDWNCSEIEARSAWEGFLWSPRLYLPFLSAIKDQLLETSRHYNDLGEHSEQYASFLTFIALDPGDAFSTEDLSIAIGHLPAAGLKESAKTLERALNGTEEQRDDYWNNRVKPFIKECWPKSIEFVTPDISESIARVCISAKDCFPDAILVFQHWLQRVEYPNYLVHLIYEAKLCSKFPHEALTYLDALVADNVQCPPVELEPCLDDIKQTDPKIIGEVSFIRLRNIIGRRGVR